MPLDLLEALALLELEEGVKEGEGFQDGVGGEGEAGEDGGDLGVGVAEGDGVGEAEGGDVGEGEGGGGGEGGGRAEVIDWGWLLAVGVAGRWGKDLQILGWGREGSSLRMMTGHVPRLMMVWMTWWM